MRTTAVEKRRRQIEPLRLVRRPGTGRCQGAARNPQPETRARSTVLEIRRRSNRSAEVLGGLAAGDRVSDGVSVREREIS